MVAEVLGVRQKEGKSMTESIALSLEHQALLLLFDNCEHVLDSVAGITSEIVARCPKARVLATSREGLAVRGEYLRVSFALFNDESDVDRALDALEAAEG